MGAIITDNVEYSRVYVLVCCNMVATHWMENLLKGEAVSASGKKKTKPGFKMGDVKISRLAFFVSFLNKSINVLNPQTALHIASVLCLNALTPPRPPLNLFRYFQIPVKLQRRNSITANLSNLSLGGHWSRIVKKCNVVLFSLWFEVSSFHTNHHSVFFFFSSSCASFLLVFSSPLRF